MVDGAIVIERLTKFTCGVCAKGVLLAVSMDVARCLVGGRYK